MAELRKEKMNELEWVKKSLLPSQDQRGVILYAATRICVCTICRHPHTHAHANTRIHTHAHTHAHTHTLTLTHTYSRTLVIESVHVCVICCKHFLLRDLGDLIS